ncbi:MAG TPA: nitroreductase family deazaflavin-dependent oxidoreductase [Rhizomicrobium sp.]
MAEAKLAPNLPDWMVEHANRYLTSGGTDGHMYKITVPQRGEITAPALLLTTTGRKSGDKFIFPLFYGTDGGSYFVIASKGGAPEHPGWYRNILANPDVEVQVGTKKMNARARTTAGEERLRLWKKALEFWPPYADYQLKTEREIPVVVLDSSSLGYVAAGRDSDGLALFARALSLCRPHRPHEIRLCPRNADVRPPTVRLGLQCRHPVARP